MEKRRKRTTLNGCEIIRVYNGAPSYVPKIGNKIEESIFRKIRTVTNDNIFDNQSDKGKPIYLNMRACFWIKAFSFNWGQMNIKRLNMKKKEKFHLSVLNSSLF